MGKLSRLKWRGQGDLVCAQVLIRGNLASISWWTLVSLFNINKYICSENPTTLDITCFFGASSDGRFCWGRPFVSYLYGYIIMISIWCCEESGSFNGLSNAKCYASRLDPVLHLSTCKSTKCPCLQYLLLKMLWFWGIILCLSHVFLTFNLPLHLMTTEYHLM